MRNRSKITRRAALGSIATGGALLLHGSYGFDRIEGLRGASVSVGDDENALLGFSETDYGEISEDVWTTVAEVTNNLSSTIGELEYEISADQEIEIRFDGETTENAQTDPLVGTLTSFAEDGVETVALRRTADSEDGTLTVGIPSATTADGRTTIEGLSFELPFYVEAQPQGSVEILTDPLRDNADEVEVETADYSNLPDPQLVVEHDGQEVVFDSAAEDTYAIDADDFGGLTVGEAVTATLYETDERETEIDSDSREVSEVPDGPAGTVSLPDEVRANEVEFDVEYTLENTAEGFLVVENEDNDGGTVERTVPEPSGTEPIDVDDIGGIERDDTVIAELFDEDGGNSLASDSLDIRREPINLDIDSERDAARTMLFTAENLSEDDDADLVAIEVENPDRDSFERLEINVEGVGDDPNVDADGPFSANGNRIDHQDVLLPGGETAEYVIDDFDGGGNIGQDGPIRIGLHYVIDGRSDFIEDTQDVD